MLVIVKLSYSSHLNFIAESFFFEKQYITCNTNFAPQLVNRKTRDIIRAWNHIAYKWSIVSTRFYCKLCEILRHCEQGVIPTKTVRIRKGDFGSQSDETMDKDHIRQIMENM